MRLPHRNSLLAAALLCALASPAYSSSDDGACARSHDSARTQYWGCATPSEKFPLPDQGAVPAAPRFLGKEQLAEADKEHKLMMALHLLVASTRMEYTSGTSKPKKEQMRARYSRAAYDLLKKEYRDSKWAKATKYFY